MYAHANHRKENYEQLSSECPPLNKNLKNYWLSNLRIPPLEDCGFESAVSISTGRIFQPAK